MRVALSVSARANRSSAFGRVSLRVLAIVRPSVPGSGASIQASGSGERKAKLRLELLDGAQEADVPVLNEGLGVDGMPEHLLEDVRDEVEKGPEEGVARAEVSATGPGDECGDLGLVGAISLEMIEVGSVGGIGHAGGSSPWAAKVADERWAGNGQVLDTRADHCNPVSVMRLTLDREQRWQSAANATRLGCGLVVGEVSKTLLSEFDPPASCCSNPKLNR